MSKSRIHPLSGEPINGKSHGSPVTLQAPRRAFARLSYDAARTGTDLDNHWQFADALSADAANSKTVRHTLIKRSRYEQGSNGYFEGCLLKHTNRIIGTGPSLRMLTGNRSFNQLVEREWYRWSQVVQLRRKLWCMAHARYSDGEVFAVLQTNPSLPGSVQLDLMPLEAEQCQTPFLPMDDRWYVDGIKKDEFGNIVWYDILPMHPGGPSYMPMVDPVRVAASSVLHWFKLVRPGASRGKPDLTSSMNVGATSRRHREATVAAAETAADFSVLLKTLFQPDEVDSVTPLSSLEIQKRMMTALPAGWSAEQMKAEHPNAQYSDFHRLQLSELGAPIAQPVNVTGGDSSNYSFASGKLDTIFYREAVDIERADCSELILDPLFAAWFREWTILADRRDIPPEHQWDWPTHPVIDAVAESTATDAKLKNGSTTLRQVYSDQGQDYEDALMVMAEDWFGDASEESIAKARQINVLRNAPPHAINAIASILGVAAQQPPHAQPQQEQMQ